MSLKPATTLAGIRENCFPKPLKSDEQIEAFYVDASAARSKHHVLVKELETRLGDRDVVRILVYGHRGCGKSTEFNRLCTQLGNKWFPVRMAAGDYLPDSGVEAEDILLAIAVALVKGADEAGFQPSEFKKPFEKVENYFAEISETKTTEKEANATAGAGVNSEKSFWGKLFGLTGKLEAELKYGRRSDSTTVRKIRQTAGELIAAVNAIIQEFQSGLGEDQTLLIIAEDLDKLPLLDADRIFAKNSQLLAAVNAHIIYTIPIFTLQCPERNRINSHFPNPKSLPMAKVITLDGQKGPGYDVLEQIIYRRIAKEAIAPDAVDLVIRRTGGVFRDVFDALLSAATSSSAEIPLSKDTVARALREMEDAHAKSIAYPVEDPEKSFTRPSSDPLFKRIEEIAKHQAAGESVSAKADLEDQVLLASGAVVEYNDEAWLGVHPLIWSWMKRQRYEMPDDPFGP